MNFHYKGLPRENLLQEMEIIDRELEIKKQLLAKKKLQSEVIHTTFSFMKIIIGRQIHKFQPIK